MSETRDRQRPLRVVVSTTERAEIKAHAQAAGLSVSAYLRNVGLGYQPPSMFDQDAIDELARLHSDQGRLGGLLKHWLFAQPGEGAPATDVRALLREIEALQKQLQAIMVKVAL